MPITRSYRCSDCGAQFDRFHLSRDEPIPDCPTCAGETAKVPGLFAIKTNRSRAIDYAQSMAEQQYGMTNLQDNQREGDIAAPPVRPPSTAETEQLAQIMAEAHRAAHEPAAPPPPEIGLQSFWAQAGGTPLGAPGGVAPGAAEARASGTDAVSLVEQAKATGHGGMKFQVVARGQGE